ncbi:MAG: hypothetical protein ABFD69_13320 [Candidatus Sumerlaeia bacterium]
MISPSRKIHGHLELLYTVVLIGLIAAACAPVMAQQQKLGISQLSLFFLSLPIFFSFFGVIFCYVNILAGLPWRRWITLVIPAFLVSLLLIHLMNRWLGPIGRGERLGWLFLKINIGGLWRGMSLIAIGAVFKQIERIMRSGLEKLAVGYLKDELWADHLVSAFVMMILGPLFVWTIMNFLLWPQRAVLGWKQLLYCYLFIDGVMLLLMALLFILTHLPERKG